MTYLSRLVLLLGVLVVSACANTTGPVNDTVSSWKLDDVSVRFGPDISRIADGQTYSSNFLWNGLGYDEGAGNRKKQVVALFKGAMRQVGDEAMTGTRPVDMKIQVNYFHALTYHSRLWCCGAHKIFADISVVDSDSGAVLAEEQNLALGRIALGGMPAVIAQMAGRDQWVRVQEGIVHETRAWLSGY